jgi:uncharacterized protein (TIGR02284 family)
MITTTEKTQQIVKELIIINNDRYEGYKTAADETKDSDLKPLFSRFSAQSKQFASELSRFITSEEEAPAEGETKHSGKLYRVWMDIKAAMTANDRKAILSSCEFGEDVALKTYKDSLEDANELPEEVRMLVNRHKTELQESHNYIKSLRDNA